MTLRAGPRPAWQAQTVLWEGMMPAEDAHLIRFLQQENIRLRQENRLLTDEVHALRRYVRALQRLQETVQRFTPQKDILDLLDETLDCALALLDAADGSLLLVDEETDELVFVLVHGVVRETLPGYRFDRRQGIAGWVVEHAEPVIVNNVRADPRFLPKVDECLGFVTRSLVAVPLAARGRVLGVIEVLNKRFGEDFTDDDVSLLSVLATLCASALDYATSAAVETEGQS
ncbi:MAG TPA: GAF domain-containing protein [Chloroflexi bacterium]|nr:GAF domain-containing protein [Chloroflexota bacterium]